MKKKVRFIFAWTIAKTLIALGYTARAKRKALAGEFILSIYFHSPDRKLFEFCISWLKKNNFNIISQKELLSINKKQVTFPRGAVIITADDGWQSNKNNMVEVANKYKTPITIFVSTEPVENGNFWWPYINQAQKLKLINYNVSQLKKMSDVQRRKIVNEIRPNVMMERQALTIDEVINISRSEFVTIGSHTITHPILITCENGVAFNEIYESKKIIENWIGKPVKYFAYPNGDYAQREINYLVDSGYDIGYTTKPNYLTREVLQTIYELPRFEVFENVSKAEAICRMLGVWQRFF